MSEKDTLRKAAETHARARTIISDAFREWDAGWTGSACSAFADAVITSLARAELLICTPDEMRDE